MSKTFAILVLAFLICPSPVKAAEGYRLLELEQFDFEYFKIKNLRDNYSPYDHTPGEHWVDGAAIHFDFTMLSWNQYRLYMNNFVHMGDTNSQVRKVGWQWETGLDLGKVNFFWDHHSQHILDDKVEDRFPLENIYGVRIIFYKRPTNN